MIEKNLDQVKFGGWWVKHETLKAVGQCARNILHIEQWEWKTGDEKDRDPDDGIQARHSPPLIDAKERRIGEILPPSASFGLSQQPYT